MAKLVLLGILFALGSTPAATRLAPVVGAQSAPREWALASVRQASFDTSTFLNPRGVSAAPRGQFFVADRGRDRIVVVNQIGGILTTFGVPGDGPEGLDTPTDVAVDALRGRVFVADSGNRRLSLFSLAGAPIGQWRGASPDHAFVPLAVAVAPSTGDVYVINRLPWGRVERFSEDGRWLSGWGEVGTGPGQFAMPEDIAVHPDGRVIVADTNTSRLQLFDPAGQHLADLGGLPAVTSVDVDPANGQIYALYGFDRVKVFLSGGTELRELRSDLLSEGFWPGAGIAVGQGSRLAVTTGTAPRTGSKGCASTIPAGRWLRPRWAIR